MVCLPRRSADRPTDQVQIARRAKLSGDWSCAIATLGTRLKMRENEGKLTGYSLQDGQKVCVWPSLEGRLGWRQL